MQATKEGSKVLVLEGEVAVGGRNDKPSQLMGKGSTADFDRNGKVQVRGEKDSSGVPELSVPSMILSESSLKGRIFGIKKGVSLPLPTGKDEIQETIHHKKVRPLGPFEL